MNNKEKRKEKGKISSLCNHDIKLEGKKINTTCNLHPFSKPRNNFKTNHEKGK